LSEHIEEEFLVEARKLAVGGRFSMFVGFAFCASFAPRVPRIAIRGGTVRRPAA
jgi:hypothetical protein